MGLNVFKEPFVGKYDGVTSPILLPTGGVSDGLNMRKVSPIGGWKVRKGCELHNTSVIDSTNAANSLHQYTHPISKDYHFIAQCNSLLYDATTDPPTKGTTFGASLGVAIGTTPGFSCQVGDWWVYADGSGTPIIYGGTTPRPLGVFTHSNSTTYSGALDLTRNVVDGDSTTEIGTFFGADDCVYVVSMERLSGVYLNLGTNVNSTSSRVMTINAMRSGSWTDTSATDNTKSGTTTLAVDGSVTWTASADDTLFCINRTMGYVYQITWSGALSNSIDLVSVTCTQAASAISNKWNGAYETITGCYFDDDSATDDIKEALGYVSNESTATYLDIGAMAAADNLYFGTPEPATGFLTAIVKDYANTNTQVVDAIKYLGLGTWTGHDDVVDTTVRSSCSFALTGTLWFEGTETSTSVMPNTNFEDRTAMYWYQIQVDGTLSADCRIYYVGYAAAPLALGTYDGCVEFKGRLILWGDKQYPNRLRYSALDRPDVLSGIDSSWSQAFGAGDTINCARNFYNELLIWKENSCWMWEGFDRVTFGSLRLIDNRGLASPQTARVVEVGTPGMSTFEPRSIAIWQDTDGVYVLDGDKPKKISMPIDHFFNPEHTACIAAADITNLSSFDDKIRNEYHLLLPTNIDYYGDQTLYVNELVYNYATDEWYPPWFRNLGLSCGLSFKGSPDETDGGRDEIYGGTSAGWVMKLESDTSDKSVADADVAIDHRLKTRGIAATQEHSSTTKFRMRKLWSEFKSRSAGTPTVNFYPDLADAATDLGTVSMINAGYALANPVKELSTMCQGCFQVELTLDVIDQEMELWSLTYEHEVIGESNK